MVDPRSTDWERLYRQQCEEFDSLVDEHEAALDRLGQLEDYALSLGLREHRFMNWLRDDYLGDELEDGQLSLDDEPDYSDEEELFAPEEYGDDTVYEIFGLMNELKGLVNSMQKSLRHISENQQVLAEAVLK